MHGEYQTKVPVEVDSTSWRRSCSKKCVVEITKDSFLLRASFLGLHVLPVCSHQETQARAKRRVTSKRPAAINYIGPAVESTQSSIMLGDYSKTLVTDMWTTGVTLMPQLGPSAHPLHLTDLDDENADIIEEEDY